MQSQPIGIRQQRRGQLAVHRVTFDQGQGAFAGDVTGKGVAERRHAEAEKERLPLDGAARNLARNTVLAARQENQWTLRLSTGHQVLVNPERTQELAGALSDYFQRRIRLNLEYDADAGDTPEAIDQERRRVRLEEARGALLEDRTVQTLILQFNARLDESSIQPRDHDQPTD